MNRRTFETLSKYVAGKNTTVLFDYPGEGACAEPKTGVIHMPGDIAGHNALAALALLMHEAAHIKYSHVIPDHLVKDPIMKDVINAIEDARIDWHNFHRLHNVKGFYERMYRDHKLPDPKKVPLSAKLLVNQILKYEQFSAYKFKDKETRQWEQAQGIVLEQLFNLSVNAIENQDWIGVDRNVKDIIKLLKITKPLDQQLPKDLNLQGAMQGDKGGDTGAVGTAPGKQVGDGSVKTPGTGTDTNEYKGIDVIDAILHPKSILAKGSMDGSRGDQISPSALQEQTKQQFKELLNLKTRTHKDEGSILDVDNLLSYHTGDIDTLFKQEIIKHEKKSKLLILMDCSGSMHAPLLDSTLRSRALVSCVKAVTEILDEVIDLEGINVDYGLAAFNSDYIKLSKDNWVDEYRELSGGTNFHNAFHQAITDLANDNSIDGKKMIVCFTDGDVCDSQLNDVKRDIITYGSDVRAMVIGIGTDPCSKMSQDIVGDNIILANENADLVLLETIGEML